MKQGVGSFHSNLSTNLIKSGKRSLNNKFFNTQDIYLYNLIRYFFLRYNEDFFRMTDYSANAL